MLQCTVAHHTSVISARTIQPQLLDSAIQITLVPIRQLYAYAQTVLGLSIASDLIRQSYAISDAAPQPHDLSRLGTPLRDYSDQ